MGVDVLEFATDDRDLAHETLETLYAFERPMRLRGRQDRFDFSLRSVTIDGLGCDDLYYGLDATLGVPPFPMFVATTVVSGRATYCAGEAEVELDRGDTACVPLDASMENRVDDPRLINVRLPLGTIEQVAAGGDGPGATPLRFHQMAPGTPASARMWFQVMTYVRGQLLGPAPPTASPLLIGALTELVAATALAVFPNSLTGQDYVRGTGWAGPAALRRAVEFIDAHAGDPITLADIASASGTTGRALQAAFHRRHGVSPMQYLRRVRLEAARRDLQLAGPSAPTTVTDVAARHGFGRAARFAEQYRDAFGELPSHTLRG